MGFLWLAICMNPYLFNGVFNIFRRSWEGFVHCHALELLGLPDTQGPVERKILRNSFGNTSASSFGNVWNHSEDGFRMFQMF